MKCEKCGTEFDSKFCPNCGAQGEDTQEKTVVKNEPKTTVKTKSAFYKKRWFIAVVIVAVVAIIAGAIIIANSNKGPKIDWSSLVLGQYLPEAKDAHGKVFGNSEKYLAIQIIEPSKDFVKNYKDECIKKGYTVESETSGSSYKAFNNEGYKLDLSMFGKVLYINLDAPEKFNEIEWPTRGIGVKLPKPKSNLGRISYDNSENFIVYIGNTPQADFKDYIKECENKGFTVDYKKDEKYYSAKDSEGYNLTLNYKGANTMEISIKAPEKEKTSTDTTNETTLNTIEESKKEEQPNREAVKPKETETRSSTNNSNGLRKEFKEAMDSYESFMNEYVDFMNKYSNSDGTNLSMLADYSRYVAKYAEMGQKFDKWKDDNMNDAETAYYLEVQARVNQKLLQVAE